MSLLTTLGPQACAFSMRRHWQHLCWDFAVWLRHSRRPNTVLHGGPTCPTDFLAAEFLARDGVRIHYGL